MLSRLRHAYNLHQERALLKERDGLLKTFLGEEAGFFVEAGANDGLRQSNTLGLERSGWRGLLIEPIPELAARCRRNRPQCLVENCALVAPDDARSTVSMTYCDLMSIVHGALKSDEADQEHVRQGARVQALQPYVLDVPARTLTDVLEQHHVSQVDFLSLDVEGYEAGVLHGLDFDRYRPTYMLIEARFRDEIDRLLDPHYRPVKELGAQDVLYEMKRA